MSNTTNREIEVKLRLEATDLDSLVVPLAKMFMCKRMIYDVATDLYWKLPNPDKFIRLRDKNELTVKTKDKSSNFNREEINLKLDNGDTDIGEAFLTSVFGPHNGSVTKEYWVYFVDELDVVISLYQIKDSKGDIFIEVESTNEFRVLETEAKVLDEMRRLGYKIEREQKSLFELYIK